MRLFFVESCHFDNSFCIILEIFYNYSFLAMYEIEKNNDGKLEHMYVLYIFIKGNGIWDLTKEQFQIILN